MSICIVLSVRSRVVFIFNLLDCSGSKFKVGPVSSMNTPETKLKVLRRKLLLLAVKKQLGNVAFVLSALPFTDQ